MRFSDLRSLAKARLLLYIDLSKYVSIIRACQPVPPNRIRTSVSKRWRKDDC